MLDEEWDPEKHDQMMQKQYGDSYYEKGADDQAVHPFAGEKDLDIEKFINGGDYGSDGLEIAEESAVNDEGNGSDSDYNDFDDDD